MKTGWQFQRKEPTKVDSSMHVLSLKAKAVTISSGPMKILVDKMVNYAYGNKLLTVDIW